MTFQLIFTAQYDKRAARFFKLHPELEKQYLKTLQLQDLNPHHPSLRLHTLSGRLQGLHSVSIPCHAASPSINVGDHNVVY